MGLESVLFSLTSRLRPPFWAAAGRSLYGSQGPSKLGLPRASHFSARSPLQRRPLDTLVCRADASVATPEPTATPELAAPRHRARTDEAKLRANSASWTWWNSGPRTGNPYRARAAKPR
ncbi:hypothetical protein CDD83_8864 [Cordyceps sp. RAO-2017]|nr:hypothetical protein CDD83_8864 [Cordyceps sp. RAO-2017]